MKKILKYTFVGLMGCSVLTSCLDSALDTAPTDSMSGTTLLSNANSAMVPLNGIYRSMYTSWSPTGNTHQSFGISSYAIMADVMGDDMIMDAMGSGWYWYDCLYNVKSRYTSSAWRSYDIWNCYYTWISNANYILAAEETMSGSTGDVNYVIGQAYAIRAYSYFMLAQNFARTYKGHEEDPCCPIYTEPTVAGTAGQPRSTVQKVYELITSDIQTAINKLTDAPAQKHKTHIDLSVAYGIQARIALTMEDWNLAKTAAHNAIEASGCTVLPVSDFLGLNDVTAANVMWGAPIQNDQTGMYASFFSHMDAVDELDVSMKPYGNSARKQINKDLYDNIMLPTDTRKQWWDPTNEESERGADAGYQQEKFKFSDYSTWLGDYIWMRVEEMYLTAAEAECMLGDETAAKNDLYAVMSKRVDGYTTSKTGTALGATSSQRTGSLREEIIDQRRIELWGEYGRIWDLRRLHQGFRRTVAQGWPDAALLSNRPTDDAECYMWVLTIPQSEFDGNVNMDLSKDQNPTGDYK